MPNCRNLPESAWFHELPQCYTIKSLTSVNWLYRTWLSLLRARRSGFWNSLPTEIHDLCVGLEFLGAPLKYTGVSRGPPGLSGGQAPSGPLVIRPLRRQLISRCFAHNLDTATLNTYTWVCYEERRKRTYLRNRPYACLISMQMSKNKQTLNITLLSYLNYDTHVQHVGR